MSIYTDPHWNSSALITIDTQNDFSLPGAQAEISGTGAVIPTIRMLLEAYRRAKLPIIHVIRLYKTDGSNVDICRRESVENGFQIVIPGSDGADLVSEIKPMNSPRLDADLLLSGELQSLGEREWVMYKPRWGAFYQTKLEHVLKEKSVDTLVFCGCNFPNCPRTSMYEASERDFRVVMVSDAISGVYERGILELRNIGASVLEAADIVKILKE